MAKRRYRTLKVIENTSEENMVSSDVTENNTNEQTVNLEELKKLKDELKNVTDQLSVALEQCSSLNDSVNEKNSVIESMKSELSHLESELKSVHVEKESVERDNDELMLRNSELEFENSNLQMKLNESISNKTVAIPSDVGYNKRNEQQMQQTRKSYISTNGYTSWN